jgi:hypothetical protein
MGQYWETLASREDSTNTQEEFETAAYRLAAEQVLYYADKHSRVAYWLVERYERDFKQVLIPFGIRLLVNRQMRYACAIPEHAKAGTATVQQTVLALVLRKIYDESARLGQLNDDGEVICDLVELEEKYRLETHRELPRKSELDALLGMLKRWGLARTSSEQAGMDGEYGPGTQPYVVVIRPAIVEVLGEVALQRLSQWSDFAAADPMQENAVDDAAESQEESAE